jgi:hypothetical protein
MMRFDIETIAAAAMLTGLGAYLYAIACLMGLQFFLAGLQSFLLELA